MFTNKRNHTSSRRSRPCLELLEDRCLPALVTWTGLGNPANNANELWSNPENWSTVAVPVNDDDVVIPSGSGGAVVRFDQGIPGQAVRLRSLVSDKPFEMAATSPGVSTTLILNGPGTFRFNNTLTLISGNIGGDGHIDVQGQIVWSRTTMFGSGTTNANGGIRFQDFPHMLDTRVINNHGVATFIGGVEGFASGASGVVFNNLPTGSFTIDGPRDFTVGAFNNQGTFIKRGGAAGDNVSVFGGFNQTSATPVVIESGTLQIGGGTQTGDFEFTGATLQLSSSLTNTPTNFNAGSHVHGTTLRVVNGPIVNFNPGSVYDVTGSSSFNPAFNSTTTFNGTVVSVGNAVSIDGAMVFFNQDISTQALSLNAGNFGGNGLLAGSGTVNVSGPITWTGGAMGGTGATNANGGIVMSGFPTIFGTRTVNNAGVATYNGTSGFISNQSVFNNLPTGSFTIDGNNDFSGGAFNNQGTFTKLAGATGDGVTRFGVTTFTNTGSITIGPGSTLEVTSPYVQSAGSTTLQNGTLTPNASLNLNGGILAGSGQINGNVVNAGTVRAGLPAGTLTINGNYVQTPTGSLDVDVGGPLPGTDFGLLSVIGTVTLDGGLSVDLINGFRPGPADTFPILVNNNSDAVIGTFAGLPEGATFPVGPTLGQISYVGSTGNDVVIRRVNRAPTADAGGPYLALEGLGASTLHGVASDPDGDPLTYAWDLDNNGTFETAGQDVTFSAGGLDGPSSQTIVLQVCDDFGDCVTSGGVVNLINIAPTATFSNSGLVNAGSPAEVSFGAPFDPSLTDVLAGFRYAYDLNNDGVFELGNGAYAGSSDSATATVPASFLDDGLTTHIVRARILDKDDGFTDYETTITTNQRPVIATTGVYLAVEGSPPLTLNGLVFDLAGNPQTYDPEGEPLTYAWDLNDDGAFETPGQQAEFLVAGLDGPSSVSVALRVSDPHGAFTIARPSITITNAPPFANVDYDGVPPGAFTDGVSEGSTPTIVLSFIDQADSAADVLVGFRYAYDFGFDGVFEIGDGTYAGSGTTASVTVPVSMLADGDFITLGGDVVIGMRIIDKDGGFSVGGIAFGLKNIAPTAFLENNGPVDEGATATVTFVNPFDPSTADTAAGFRYTYDFFVDGTNEIGDRTYTGSTTSATITVPMDIVADGPDAIEVRGYILDKDNGFFTSFTTILIDNVAPTAVLSNSGPVNQGASGTVSFSEQLDRGAADVAAGFHYAYDFDNDGAFEIGNGTYAGSSTLPSAMVPVSFLVSTGVRTVRARIIDKDGGFTDYSTAITVLPGQVGPNTVVWNGGSTLSANWSDPANWAGGVAPTAGDDLVFSSGSARLSSTNDFPAGTQFNSITLDGGAYTLAGNRLILGDGGLTANSGNHVLSFDVRASYGLPAGVSAPILVAQAGTLELSGVVGGAMGLYKTGAGALILSGANTYTGATWVAQGVLEVRNRLALGSTAGGTQVCGGARLTLQSGLTIANEALTLEDPDPEKGGEVVPGPAVLAIVTGGSGPAPTSWHGPVHLNPGSPQTQVEQGAAFEISGVIGGPGALQKMGPGTLILSAANTYKGGTTVLEGILTLRNGSALGAATTATAMHGGTTLVLENNITLRGDFVLVGDPPGTVLPAVRVVSTGTNTVSGKIATNPLLLMTTLDGSLTIAGVIDGNDDLVKDGPGTLTLTADNSLHGTIFLAEGTLLVHGSQPNTPIVVEGGRLGGTGVLGPITLNGGQIQGAVIQASPIEPGKTDLVVGGTSGDDTIRVRPMQCADDDDDDEDQLCSEEQEPGCIKVVVNGVTQGSFNPTGRIIVYAQQGDDDVKVNRHIARSAWLDGGAGNDRLKGGSGSDVLLGGAGDDMLIGAAGRDLLIGGFGADRIRGAHDDDILIAGTTDFDADVPALAAIMAEWTWCDATYGERINHLEHGGGRNGTVVLSDATVHDDGRADRLTGSAGRDWFFANLDGGVRDTVTDDHRAEAIEDID